MCFVYESARGLNSRISLRWEKSVPSGSGDEMNMKYSPSGDGVINYLDNDKSIGIGWQELGGFYLGGAGPEQCPSGIVMNIEDVLGDIFHGVSICVSEV
jgi:hypothetical protein